MISSTSNNQVKNIISLQKKARERRAQRLFVVEGIRAICEVPPKLLRAVYVSEDFAATPDYQAFWETMTSLFGSFSFELVTSSVFKAMCDTVTPQGVLALVAMPDFTFEEALGQAGKPPCLVILESLQDPGNMGTIVRTAEGAGVTGIIMNTGTVDIYSPKVVRSTMGSIFRVPHIIVPDLLHVVGRLQQEYGLSIYAAHLKGQAYYDAFDYTSACGFMIGNEGNGLTEDLSRAATSYLRIPMEGRLESLNASVAASILMYEAHRQRRLY